MKRFNTVLLCLIMITPIACSQSDVTSKNGGQGAMKFAPDIFNNLDVFALTFEPDGKTLYVTVGLKDGGGLFWSEFRNNKWENIKKIEFSNGKYNDNDLFPSPDGTDKYFFMTKRPLNGDDLEKVQNIWVVERNGTKWGNMYPITIVNSEARDGFPSVTMDGDLYFFSSREGGFGSADIYKSEKVDGVYQKPNNIGSVVNSEYWDGLPYVTPNGKVMILFSDRPDGYGDGDLFVSYFDNGNWTKPENLGQNVNSDMSDVTPFIGPEKKYLYFSRVENVNGAHKRSIYFIDIKNTSIRQDLLN